MLNSVGLLGSGSFKSVLLYFSMNLLTKCLSTTPSRTNRTRGEEVLPLASFTLFATMSICKLPKSALLDWPVSTVFILGHLPVLYEPVGVYALKSSSSFKFSGKSNVPVSVLYQSLLSKSIKSLSTGVQSFLS